MIQIKKKVACCGCSACAQICPQQCIDLLEDSEGFLYPMVNIQDCIHCGLCEATCPVIHQTAKRYPLTVYAAYCTDDEIRRQSSSGGLFSVVAEAIIRKHKGVVFGAKFNKRWDVQHDFTDSVDGLSAFRGSKYLQSRVGESYQQAQSFLRKGRQVLFTGTPCQIAGLKLFLREDYDNLITMDVACLGVPSPKVFHKYLDETLSRLQIKQRHHDFSANIRKETITDISFRDKTFGWREYSFSIKIAHPTQPNAKVLLLRDSLNTNMYRKGFLMHLFLRPSCHACPAKHYKSGSDITLADYWGIEQVVPSFDDDKGISLVLLNTPKGCTVFSSLDVECVETPYADAVKYNPHIERSADIPVRRDAFFNHLNQRPFRSLVVPTLIERVISKMRGSRNILEDNLNL
jgi:ferredoxin-like protein FixX